MRITFVVALLVFGSHTSAQGWSTTANAPVPGSATASATTYWGPPVTNSATLPVGPVLPGTFLTCNVSSYATSSLAMAWTPAVSGSSAPLAFTATSTCSSAAGSGSTYAGGNAQIDLTLLAPQPVAGRLLVHAAALDVPGWPPSTSRIDLDVMADGSVECSAQTGAALVSLDILLHIPTTGAVIRLNYACSTSASSSFSQYMSANRTIEVQFFPGEPVVAPFATFSGASTMSIDHDSAGMVTLSIEGPGLTPVLMAFGGTAISVPLLPYVTVLVSLDVLIGSVGTITVPLPPFPSGTAIYAQGLVLDAGSVPRGTNSVRALWP